MGHCETLGTPSIQGRSLWRKPCQCMAVPSKGPAMLLLTVTIDVIRWMSKLRGYSLTFNPVTPIMHQSQFIDSLGRAYQLASIIGPGNCPLTSITCFWYPSGDARPLETVKSYFLVCSVAGILPMLNHSAVPH